MLSDTVMILSDTSINAFWYRGEPPSEQDNEKQTEAHSRVGLAFSLDFGINTGTTGTFPLHFGADTQNTDRETII